MIGLQVLTLEMFLMNISIFFSQNKLKNCKLTSFFKIVLVEYLWSQCLIMLFEKCSA